MEAITIHCNNHQCLKTASCARYAGNAKKIGLVKRFNCQANGYNMFIPNE